MASSNLKSTQTQSDLLGQVEALFNDLNTPETGLSGALDTFFQGLHDLAQHPQGLSERSSVLQQGANVAEAFHRLANGLQGLYQERNAKLGDAVVECESADHTISHSESDRSRSVRWIPRITPTPCVISRTSS